jgi:hypothetical protein
VLIVLGVLLFLAISGELARFLTVENVERDDEVALLAAQAAGDEQRMLNALSGCRQQPACVASVSRNARTLKRRGAIRILQLTSTTAYTLTAKTGPTRVAWKVANGDPVVQCVQVRRSGNPFTGIKIALLALSAPISKEADC